MATGVTLPKIELHLPGSSRVLAALRATVRNPVVRIIARRLLFAPPLLFIVSGLSFLLLWLEPGDAARLLAGPTATQQVYLFYRHELGLDVPFYERYWHWLVHALHGDLGVSLISQLPITSIIGDRLQVTVSLILLCLAVSLFVGVPLGVFSAVRGGVTAKVLDGLALIGFAVPGYWLGAILISAFAVKLHLFPVVGYTPFSQSPLEWLRSLVLPVIALSLSGFAGMAKLTREAMLDALASEHVRLARANGIPGRSIVFIYALKQAGLRVVTLLGLTVVGLLTGTVLVETVFALPGLGTAIVTGVEQHDVPVVQGITLFFTLIIILTNLAVDLAYVVLDPRVRRGGAVA